MSTLRPDGRPRRRRGEGVARGVPVVTGGAPETAEKGAWSLTLDGDVEQAITLDWEGFQALPQREFSADLHCVTRWSKLGTLWRGVAVSVLADLVRPVADPVYVQARADGNYTANLRLVDMLSDKAFVATEFDGKPLSVEHGGPARLVVPDLYLWKSAKWLRGLHFSPYDYKGFWEKLGYHNYGDPWKEQRYRG